MAKTLDQAFAESGKQSELDALRATPGAYEKAVASYNETGALPTFGNANEVGSFLNNFQNNAFNSSPGMPQVQSLTDIANEVKGIANLPTEVPKAPNLLETYQTQRTNLGLDLLEADIRDLTAQEDALVAENRVRTNAQLDKPQALGVIAGRVGEVERQTNERLDVIGRAKSRKIEEYKAGLTNIQTIMDLTQQDYVNAKQSYDTQFEQSMSMLNMVRGIQNDQKTDVQRAIDNSRANLQIFMNTITKGNLSYSSLSNEQKMQINKLEVQAGLPVGFMSNLKIDPGADILFTSSNEGVTQVGIRQPDGSVKVESYGTKNPTKLTESEKESALVSKYASLLANTVVKEGNQAYGHVSPASFRSAMAKYQSEGGTVKSFTDNFSQYADPNRGDFVAAYGFDLSGRTQYKTDPITGETTVTK